MQDSVNIQTQDWLLKNDSFRMEMPLRSFKCIISDTAMQDQCRPLKPGGDLPVKCVTGREGAGVVRTNERFRRTDYSGVGFLMVK